jgi:uncharacterized MAPEG superfamily protein
MPNALKSVVETGATTLAELVDDARSLIEDLPPMANRRKRAHRNWSSVFLVVLLAFVAMMVAKQLRHRQSDTTAEPKTL